MLLFDLLSSSVGVEKTSKPKPESRPLMRYRTCDRRKVQKEGEAGRREGEGEVSEEN